MSLNELATRAHDTAVRKGWYGQARSAPELLMLVVSELAEALECARETDKLAAILRGTCGKPLGFPIELADAIIRIVDMAAHYGIDLDEAVRVKMAYNERREHRHGGKRF